MRNFEELLILPAENGIVVRKRTPEMRTESASDVHVFNNLDDFYRWFTEYSEGEQ